MRKVFASQLYSIFHNKLFVWGVLFAMLLVAISIYGLSYIPDTQQSIEITFDDQAEIKRLEIKKLFAEYNVRVYEGKNTDDIVAKVPAGTMLIGMEYGQAKREYMLNDYWINHFDEYKEYISQQYNYDGRPSFEYDFTPNSRRIVMAQKISTLGSLMIIFFSILVVLYQTSYDIRHNIVKNYVVARSSVSKYFVAKFIVCAGLVLIFMSVALAFCLIYAGDSAIKGIFLSFGKMQLVPMKSVFAANILTAFNFALMVMAMFMLGVYLTKKIFNSLAVVSGIVALPYLLGVVLDKAQVGQDVLRFIPIYNLFNGMYGFGDVAFWIDNLVVIMVTIGMLTIFVCRYKLFAKMKKIRKNI